MSGAILTVEGLRVMATDPFGATKTLVDGVDLSLSRGEILGLIGESGAGKTTIGLAVLGYTRPSCHITDGRIVFDGMDIRALVPEARRKIRGRRIAYIAQSAAASFNPAKTILAQVCETPIRHGLMSYAEAKRMAVAYFRELSLPSPETFGDRYPHQVSGGQLQRAMAAMAMSCQPDILILDEPTTALDVTTQIEVLAAIRNLIRNHQTAGLYISHDLAVVAQIAQRILVLRNGRPVEMGDTGQILYHPRAEYTRRLVADRRGTSPTVVAAGNKAEPLLSLDRISAAYGEKTAVRDASLHIRRGETVAVVGESGSGKSTLARVICGAHPPATGRILFYGQVLAADFASRTRTQLQRIQMIYQMPDIALNPRQTVGEIIGRPLAFYFGMDANRRRRRVDELLDLIDLPTDYAARRPQELSGGQKQRICIARALAAEPDLVVCDEATSSLDPLVAEEILNLLATLQKRTGVAYLFISHDLSTVRRIADRVIVMLQGAIVADGSFNQVFQQPQHPYTRLLLSSVPEMRPDWLDDLLKQRASEVSA